MRLATQQPEALRTMETGLAQQVHRDLLCRLEMLLADPAVGVASDQLTAATHGVLDDVQMAGFSILGEHELVDEGDCLVPNDIRSGSVKVRAADVKVALLGAAAVCADAPVELDVVEALEIGGIWWGTADLFILGGDSIFDVVSVCFFSECNVDSHLIGRAVNLPRSTWQERLRKFLLKHLVIQRLQNVIGV